MDCISLNPYDGRRLGVFPGHEDDDVDRAIASAHRSFLSWRHSGRAERAEVLTRAAQWMRTHVAELAEPLTLETGKRIGEARAEVQLAADILEHHAQHAPGLLATQQLRPQQGQACIETEPLGVLLGVQSARLPYLQLARFVAPNLMAGNVVLVKHASGVPQCAEAYARVWQQAGAPEACYTNLRLTHAQVRRVIGDARVRAVALTGSADAGRSVGACAGQALKEATVELGGNDAFVVLDDADLDAAVRWALWSMLNHMGQCSVAARRFVVVESVADRFLDKLQTGLSQLEAGDPMDPATTLGPLASEVALHRLLDQLRTGLARGARLLMGGHRLERPGAFVAPTVVDGVEPDNPLYRQELLGPVALFFRVRHESAALDLVNDSDFGFGAAIFSGDVARAQRMARRVDCGMVFINHPVWLAPELPFGGTKASGHGRGLSMPGVHGFVNQKLVRVVALDSPP